jgi:hypothetical protein
MARGPLSLEEEHHMMAAAGRITIEPAVMTWIHGLRDAPRA